MWVATDHPEPLEDALDISINLIQELTESFDGGKAHQTMLSEDGNKKKQSK